MKIIGQGLSSVVLESSPTECIKVYPSRFSEYSQRQETRPALLAVLTDLDPHQEMFVQGKPCKIPKLPNKYEIYGRHVDHVIQSHKARQVHKLEMTFVHAVRFPRLQPMDDFSMEDIEFLVRAIEKLHSRGWTHRDLHCWNVMRGEDGNPRIIDWGEAEETDDSDIDWNSLNAL